MIMVLLEIALVVVLVISTICLIVKLKYKKVCKHPIAERMGRAVRRKDNEYPVLKITCDVCGKEFEDRPLATSTMDYLKDLCRSGFLTKDEIKRVSKEKWFEGIKNYNIFVDG